MIDRTLAPAGLSDFGPATTAALIIAAYLALAEPYVGMVLHRRFEAAERHHENARRWLYRRLLLLEWVLAALCLSTVLISDAVPLAAVGLRLPDGAWGWIITVAVIGASWSFVAKTASQVARSPDAQLPAIGRGVLAMLPRTPIERRLFGIVSVSAGICEEIIYRGFLIALTAAVLPGAPVWVCGLIAAVVFAAAHLYQGPQGILGSFLIGLVLTALYLGSGSLLAPIVAHALIDMRAIWLGKLAPMHYQLRTA